MKNQILKHYPLLAFIILVFFACNRNDPVGGDFIKDRAGAVVCDTITDIVHIPFGEYSATGSCEFLYAGKNTTLETITLLSFERPLTKTVYDSAIFVFTVKSKGGDEICLKQFFGDFFEDSVISWGDIEPCEVLSDSPLWVEDTTTEEITLTFSLEDIILKDTINVALCSGGDISVIYSNNSYNPPILKLFRGPLLEIIEPFRDAFVDTILLEGDTVLVASGSYTWKDTLFLADSLIDFGVISSINNAFLFLPINSFSGPTPELCIRYKDNPSNPYTITTESDTVIIEVTKFIDEWIEDEERFLIIEGEEGSLFTANISKDITLELIYTENPERR